MKQNYGGASSRIRFTMPDRGSRIRAMHQTCALPQFSKGPKKLMKFNGTGEPTAIAT